MIVGGADSQVTGNCLLKPMGRFPRGSQVQVWSYMGQRSRNILISDNYAVASTDSRYSFKENQSDGINLGFVDGATVRNNYMTGGHAAAGCAIIADESANSVQILSNTLVDTGHCGI